MNAPSSAVIRVRKSIERGFANHGWLKTYHTFSFASYHDSKYEGYRSLRVLNEDRVSPGEGFGTHGHANFEIFSYVIEGYLEHKDSMNNREVLKRGDVQFTSAGSGIRHSEYNHSQDEDVHFLQIWVKPNQNNLRPAYETKHFSEESKTNRLCLIVAPKKRAEEGLADNRTDDNRVATISINQDINVYASILEKGKEVKLGGRPGRYGYVHVCQTGGAIRINDTRLEQGDGAFIEPAEDELTFVGDSDKPAEFLVFDLA